jgi:aryl-alcohol dehydrogenase
MKVTAALIESRDAPFVLAEVELADMRPDEMVVEVHAVGMCHSDLSVRAAATPFPLPAVLGHEGAGVVQRVGAQVTGFSPGDHVVLSFDSCGSCRACVAGSPVYCEHWIPLNLLGGSRLDGSPTLTRADGELHGHFFGQSSFATHALVSARAAVKVPPELPLRTLAPLGCSVQTGVGSVVNVARPSAGSTIVVFGAGGVGLAAVMAAALTSAARIVAVDVQPERLELAAGLGATDTINAADEDPREVIASLTGGPGADYTIETSGRLPVLDQALSSLAAAGTCVVVGAPPLGSVLEVDVPNLLGRGIRLIGTNQGGANPKTFIPRLVDLHLRGRLPFDKLIREYPMSAINDAAADAASGKTVKPVLVLGD